MSEQYFFQKASFLARLGSGSACRSVKGSVVVWETKTTSMEVLIYLSGISKYNTCQFQKLPGYHFTS
jgi:mevalonate pyrophosphate decarboxylase